MDKKVFISLSIEDLQTVITDCVNSCLKVSMQENNAPTTKSDKLLTIKEASQFLKLTVSTLYSKVSRNEIPYMKQGKRLYFSNIELMDYVKKGRRKSTSEIEVEAEAYLSNKKKGLK